jgi:DNA-binding MarR family transcriptional regulator
MKREIEDITSIDRIIHEPARLAIVAVLSSCESADFKSLLHLTGLTKGNLSAQLQKLEEAGYITISKSFQERYPLTTCRLTDAGRVAFQSYWKRVKALEGTLNLE